MPPKKPAAKGTRTGANARSGPSGPSIPRSQRRQTKIELSLSPSERATLETAAARQDETKSALVAALIASHLQGEEHFSPVHLETARRIADRTGQALWLVLDSALSSGLDLLLESEATAAGGELPAEEPTIPTTTRRPDGTSTTTDRPNPARRRARP